MGSISLVVSEGVTCLKLGHQIKLRIAFVEVTKCAK
jgi:hypothetical protein